MECRFLENRSESFVCLTATGIRFEAIFETYRTHIYLYLAQNLFQRASDCGSISSYLPSGAHGLGYACFTVANRKSRMHNFRR